MNQITIGVDTNVFLHYGQIKLLDWRKHFGGVTHVRLLVARQVQREMDKQKDFGKGYLQTRAKEYQRLLLESEGNGYIVTFERDDVTVEIEFLRHTRKSDLDEDLFDLTSPDQLIVAEYYRAAAKYPGLIVFANDTGTIMAAIDARMPTARPEPAWVRVEPEDEVVKQLRQDNEALKRQLGATPKLELRNFESEVVQPVPCSFIDFDVAAYLRDLDHHVFDTTPVRSAESLIREHGVYTSIRRVTSSRMMIVFVGSWKANVTSSLLRWCLIQLAAHPRPAASDAAFI